MNKAEIIDHVAEKTKLPKSSVSTTLDIFLEAVTLSLKKGDPVVLVNFGTFTVKMRAARQGRNPSTGAPIKIGAAKVVGFKAGKALKEAVKETVKETVVKEEIA